MSELPNRLEVEDLQRNLQAVRDLLHRQQVVEHLVGRQEMPKHELVEQLVHKQHLAELSFRFDRLHPADVAAILEGLPPEERLTAWQLVRDKQGGRVLLELTDA